MNKEYYINHKIFYKGKLYKVGEKIKLSENIANKFPGLFSEINHLLKKIKNKKNDRTTRTKGISEDKR